MGQYHKIVNLDKKQFIDGHAFGDGIKLMEFGSSGGGTMMGLAVLLAANNGLGGGDFRGENVLVGSWAGDRIVIAGDYGDKGVFIPEEDPKVLNLYEHAEHYFEDISDRVVSMLVGAGEMDRKRAERFS